jgi:chromosome segregation ATPase
MTNEKMINEKNFKKPYTRKSDRDYGYYSRVLNKPFDSIEELREAEATYHAELKAKEDKVAQKKADAQKVDDAFKAMNAARKEYKEKLTQLTKEYSEELTKLKNAFELGKKDIHAKMAAAEEAYQKALKEFTDRYETYHLSLKDGDFETTISGSKTQDTKKVDPSQVNLFNIFDLFFGL